MDMPDYKMAAQSTVGEDVLHGFAPKRLALNGFRNDVDLGWKSFGQC